MILHGLDIITLTGLEFSKIIAFAISFHDILHRIQLFRKKNQSQQNYIFIFLSPEITFNRN